MSTQEQSPSVPDVPPPMAFLQMMTGYWVSQAIHVAAKLGLADVLQDGPKSSEELARAVGADPRALYRLLRALASVGVFSEDEGNRFGLTPLAGYLQSRMPGSLRSYAIGLCEPWFWRPWGDLLSRLLCFGADVDLGLGSVGKVVSSQEEWELLIDPNR